MEKRHKMKIVFLGATNFSKELLLHLLENNFTIDMLFSIPQEFNISYSNKKVKNYNHFNFKELAENYNIPYFEVESNGTNQITDYYNEILTLKPDVILVMGWYYMVPKKIRDLAKYGTWGIHASLLPKYAGGAPLVWAIINGEKETGVTLFKLDNGIDDGDIIAQQTFPILYEDSIKEVYDIATEVSKHILVKSLLNIDNIKFSPQNKLEIKVWPQRKPEDGEINLNWESEKIYNFIRAQAPPYPGAFIKTIDGKKIIIEKAKLI